MTLSTFSRRIGEVLESRERNTPRAEVLMDQYAMLTNSEEREAFVAALIHRVLVEGAQRRHH